MIAAYMALYIIYFIGYGVLFIYSGRQLAFSVSSSFHCYSESRGNQNNNKYSAPRQNQTTFASNITFFVIARFSKI
jgi:hypothetical protein